MVQIHTAWCAAAELRADADFMLSLVKLHADDASQRGPILAAAAEGIRAEVAARADPGHTISHTNLKIGQVNRQIYKVPRIHDARLWSHSSS
jgi:hypothetical protein